MKEISCTSLADNFAKAGIQERFLRIKHLSDEKAPLLNDHSIVVIMWAVTLKYTTHRKVKFATVTTYQFVLDDTFAHIMLTLQGTSRITNCIVISKGQPQK